MIKKLAIVALLAAGGWFVYKRRQAGKAEQSLWAEATDPVTASTTD